MNKKKLMLILSTQRSGSTMVCDDIQGVDLLGSPSEYFIDTIEKYQRNESIEAIKLSFMNAFSYGKTKNGFCSIKIMSNQIIPLGKILNKIGLCKNNSPEECFYNYFKDSFILVLERKNKLSQAISRVLAQQRRIYHSIIEDSEKKLKGVGSFTYKDIDDSGLNYSEIEIKKEIDKIASEESLLNNFLYKYNLEYKKIYYEDVVDDRSYVQDIANLIGTKESVELLPRRLKKISGDINEMWAIKFKSDTV